MIALAPCPSCSRHVRVAETACPFCASPLALQAVLPRAMPTQRLGRAAVFAFGAVVAASAPGCGANTTMPGTDSGGPGDDAYVAPMTDAGTDATIIAAYGGPPHDSGLPPPQDTGASNDSEMPDSWGAALYGAPPP